MTYRFVFLSCAILFLFSGILLAASPSSATINPDKPSAAWQGQTYLADATVDPTACPPSSLDTQNTVCDHFFLTVAVDPSFWDKNAGGAQVNINWPSTSNDFDVYVFDKDGNQVASSTQGGTNSEQLLISKASGTYEIVVTPFSVVNSSYSATANFVSERGPRTSPKWKITTHGECCEGNLATSGPTTYVLLPELVTGNDIKTSNDGGQTWNKVYPPADVSVPFGIEGDLRAFQDDVVFFGTELTHGVAAHSDNRGKDWTIVQIPVAFAANDQAWHYMGPLKACPVQTEPYVLTGWYRIGSVALFSCDGGLTWPIQTPLAGLDGSGPFHVVCEATARDPLPLGIQLIANANFARMRAGRHGGWGTDGKFYWSEAVDGNVFICKTNTFGATWEGIKHPWAEGTPDNHPVTLLAFDDKGILYVLHANKLYVSFDQGESIRFVHTLPRWGNDASVADRAGAMFVVSGGTIHIGLKETGGKIWYLQGKNVHTSKPIWKEELVDIVDSIRLDFMMLAIDGNGIPTIGYTTPPNFDKGVTTASRNQPVQ